MSLGEVNYIDVVADAGSIRSIIIVTEDGELLADTHSSLSYVRNQVVWHTVWQLTDFCRWMSTDWVEVSQDDTLDVSTTMDIVCDDLLVHLLGIAIRRSSLLMRSLLSYRQVLWLRLTVNGAGRREDNTLYIIFWHQLKQVDERNQVVAVVQQRLLYTLTYSLAGSKVNDTLDGRILLEHSLCSCLVTKINLLESWTNTCNLLDTVKNLNL